jgi:TonB family protein
MTPPRKRERRPDGRYLAQLRGLFERLKEYPVQARKAGQTGTTMVSFILGKNGELKKAGIAVPSGRMMLDRAALRAVGSVGRFPPFRGHPGIFTYFPGAVLLPYRVRGGYPVDRIQAGRP